MLGEIIGGLTDATTAEDVATAVAGPEMLARIKAAAAAEGRSVGVVIADTVRHVIERGGEDIWLDLLSRMSGSARPGAVAVERVLAYAFPDPVRVRVTRRAG
jgi:hypothetical protein